MPSPRAPAARLDDSVVAAADAVQEAMRRDLLQLAGRQAAVVGAAPAGAGKSHFVASTVGLLRASGLRVALAAPTNDQVQSLVQRVKELNPDLPGRVRARPGPGSAGSSRFAAWRDSAVCF